MNLNYQGSQTGTGRDAIATSSYFSQEAKPVCPIVGSMLETWASLVEPSVVIIHRTEKRALAAASSFEGPVAAEREGSIGRRRQNKPDLGHQGRRTKLSLMLCMCACGVLCWLQSIYAADTNETPAYWFKKYLSTPPCIEKLVYCKLSSEAPRDRRLISVCGNNFYIRQIKDGENFDVPISETNLMQGAFFAGKGGAMRWQINGFGVGESFPDPAKPDAYAAFSDTMRNIVNGILNLGPQMIEPGTFVWDGDQFQARPSSVALQFRPQQTSFTGTVTVVSNRVVELETGGVLGVFRYEYDEAANLPPGIPARILVPEKGGTWKPVVQIEQLVLSKDNLNPAWFTPEYHIEKSAAILTVVSNNSTLQAPNPANKEVVRLVSIEVQAKAKAAHWSWWRARLPLFVIVVAVVVPALIFLFRHVSKWSSQPKV